MAIVETKLETGREREREMRSLCSLPFLASHDKEPPFGEVRGWAMRLVEPRAPDARSNHSVYHTRTKRPRWKRTLAPQFSVAEEVSNIRILTRFLEERRRRQALLNDVPYSLRRTTDVSHSRLLEFCHHLCSLDLAVVDI